LYHSVESLSSSHLLSKNLKIKIHKAIILPVVLHGWETWSLTLREENISMVFQNRVLQRIFRLGKGKVVPVHFLTEHYAMMVYWGVEV
jgi:hypothetical protein